MNRTEYGPSGPTAVKDIDPTGTGLSDAMAAFVTANASPFTNPRDMPAPAKVPDPRNTQNTETMFIWAHFDVPVIGVQNGAGQLIASNPDVLAPVPVTWMNGVGDTNNTRTTPDIWADNYEASNLADLVYQQHQLADRAKTYRIVGHGLKVWVSQNTTVSRGNIEAGQFSFDDARNLTPTDPATWSFPYKWTDSPGYLNDTGAGAMFLQNRDIYAWRQMIASARDQEIGFLAADEGATVRWTDTNDFQFQPAAHRMCMYPLSYSYGQQGYRPFETINSTAAGVVETAANSYQITPPSGGNLPQGDLPLPNPYSTKFRKLATAQRNSGNSCTQSYYAPLTIGNITGPTTRSFACIANRDSTLTPYTSAINQNYFLSSDQQFNKGLYCDLNGLSADQVLTVQVVWHVEYVPKGIEPWSGEASPVDMDYEEMAAMLRNRLAFPIVVKGHSFFSNLRAAIGKAARGALKIFGVGGKVVGAALSMVPHPKAQAAGMGLSMIGTAADTISEGIFSRKRRAPPIVDGIALD